MELLEDAIMVLMRSGYAGEVADDAPLLKHICPPGVEPGQLFLVEDNDGEVYAVEVPTGIRPGMPFQAHPETLGSLNDCLDVARAVRAVAAVRARYHLARTAAAAAAAAARARHVTQTMAVVSMHRAM